MMADLGQGPTLTVLKNSHLQRFASGHDLGRADESII